MRHYTKQWQVEKHIEHSREFHKLFAELIAQGCEPHQAHLMIGDNIDRQRKIGIHNPAQVTWDYQRHYNQIRPHLTVSVMDISDTDSLHDCFIVEPPIFFNNDFCVKFSENGVWFGREWFKSVNFDELESDSFRLGEIIFKGAKISKNELCFENKVWAICVCCEVYLHEEGYEMHILSRMSDGRWAELIIVFNDLIIRLQGK